MGRMATYTGNMITWDEAMKSDKVLMPEQITWESTPPVVPGPDGNYPIPMPGQSQTVEA